MDTSLPETTPHLVEPANVTEIIDHREDHATEGFPNADVQIEMVGAAATLIAEKFYEDKLEISEVSATLLYAAIIDNTVRLKADVTTDRDRNMAEWLEQKVSEPEKLVHQIFRRKSKLEGGIKEELVRRSYTVNYSGNRILACQFEMLDAEEFIAGNTEEIDSALADIQDEQNLDFAFLTAADVNNGHIMKASSKKAEKVLSNAVQTEFKDGTAREDSIILRKQVMPRIREELEK